MTEDLFRAARQPQSVAVRATRAHGNLIGILPGPSVQPTGMFFRWRFGPDSGAERPAVALVGEGLARMEIMSKNQAYYLERRQAAKYLEDKYGPLAVAPATLAKMAVRGDGPAFVKFGKRVETARSSPSHASRAGGR